jgi:hypothetical protein
MIRSTRILLAATLLLIAAPALPGQVCVGIPTHDGQLHLAGVAALGGDAPGYGMEFGANFTGYLSSAFAYLRSEGDEGATDRFDGRFTYEIPVTLPQACPTLGVSLTRFDDGSERLTVPVGIGIGGPILFRPTVEVGLHAIPRYLWVQDRMAGEHTRTDGFGAELGGSVALGRVFLGGGVSIDTLEGSTTGGILRLGVSF